MALILTNMAKTTSNFKVERAVRPQTPNFEFQAHVLRAELTAANAAMDAAARVLQAVVLQADPSICITLIDTPIGRIVGTVEAATTVILALKAKSIDALAPNTHPND